MRFFCRALPFMLVFSVLTSITSLAFGATATITLLNNPPTDLAVGESYTIDIQVISDDPFTLASVQGDIHFPAYLLDRGDNEQNATSAVLHLTFIGNRVTSDLPGGVIPASAVVGVRYRGGQFIFQQFDFSVAVH